jgi:hypothetical protein
MAADSGASLLKAVDGILDTLTDGEHTRTMKQLEGETEKEEIEPTTKVVIYICNKFTIFFRTMKFRNLSSAN